MTLRAATLLLLLAGPVLAQQPPPPSPAPPGPAGEDPGPPPLGLLLARAEQAGLLPRVLGERSFHLQDSATGFQAVVRVRAQRAQDPPTLVVDVVTEPLVGPAGGQSVQVLFGLAGNMLAFRMATQALGRTTESEGRVQEGARKIEVVLRQDGQEAARRTADWHPHSIPGPAVMFLLPALADLLPDGELEFIQLDEGTGRVGLRRLRFEAPLADSGPSIARVTIVDAGNPRAVQLVANVAPDGGKILQILRGPTASIVAISAEEAQLLLLRRRREVEAQGPAPGSAAGPGTGAGPASGAGSR